jgi:hypothetical protein
MKTMKFKHMTVLEYDVLLFLHTADPPTVEEWRDCMQRMREYAKTIDVKRLSVLVISDGGGPDSLMRGELTDFYEHTGHTLRTSVIATSVIVRGIVTALSWFNPQMKAYSPKQMPSALKHLNLPLPALPRILREFKTMEKELTPNTCLSLASSEQTAVAS